MDHFADERDLALLEGDRYTFSVLHRVIGGACRLLLTDHTRLIVCHTAQPYPVWIWTPDDASEAEYERAYRIAAEHSLLNGEYSFNLKYAAADHFIRRAAAEGRALSVRMRMFAYDCREAIPPTVTADGGVAGCEGTDSEELADLIGAFQDETGVDKTDRDTRRRDAEAFIRGGRLFFWENGEGKRVACCKYGTDGGMAYVNFVYTYPDFRRRHYAENLVYRITCRLLDEGYIPTLYADADCAASNACYRKIGYVCRGGLCTIG